MVESKYFDDFEAQGMSEMEGACFVLVAGGLGERLGYNGIKVELPVEVTTDTCYLQVSVWK
jgi:UDP-sugar pyrophosphorylase